MRILYLPNSHCQQRQLEKPNFLAYPVRLAMEAQRQKELGNEVAWGKKPFHWKDTDIVNGTSLTYQGYFVVDTPQGIPFLSLPHPDRVWTGAKDKKYQKNGNFKYHPGTYIQSASGCWWGRCEFCVEKGQSYEVRPVEDVISEIEEIKSQGYKEVFDDSATFPNGEWLEQFCRKIVGNKSSIVFSCNVRLVDYDFQLMANSGFRMLLFGLESANQQTLDNINKGVKIEKAIEVIKKASRAGLEPHVAVIFGHPNETDEDAIRTLKLVHYLLRKGYAKTAQASFYKVPGEEGKENHRKYIKRIYDVGFYPQFWFSQLKDIKDINDIKYLWRKIKAGLGWL